jgi:GT2 family glycosyltransferase
MISVIIVSYNNPDLLRQTLLSLRTYHQNLEIIVIDNSNTNDVEEMIISEFNDIIFKRMESNIGFGRANNIGVQLSTGDIIVFLNNDVIFEQDVITPLVNALEEDKLIGIIGPKLLNKDKSLQYSCCNFPSVGDILKSEIWGEYAVSNWYLTNWDHHQRRKVDYVSGALMVMRRDSFESVGGFDEIYFMYTEEVDLCYRLKNAGYYVEYFPNVDAIHLGGASTSLNNREINVHLYLSRLKFRLKHFGIVPTLFQISGLSIVSIFRYLLISMKIFMIKKNREPRVAQLIRTGKKLKLMFVFLMILIFRNKKYFLNHHKIPIKV